MFSACQRCTTLAAALAAAEARVATAEKATASLKDSKDAAASNNAKSLADAKAKACAAEGKQVELEKEVAKLMHCQTNNLDQPSSSSSSLSFSPASSSSSSSGLALPVDYLVAASSVSTCDFGALDPERGSVSWHVPGTCSGALGLTGCRNKVAGWRRVYGVAAMLLLVGFGRALVGGGQVMASSDLAVTEKTTKRSPSSSSSSSGILDMGVGTDGTGVLTPGEGGGIATGSSADAASNTENGAAADAGNARLRRLHRRIR